MTQLIRANIEAKAIEKIEKLSEQDFTRLANLVRNEKWTYVGSAGISEAEDAFWMKFADNQFTMINASSYGEGQYSLITETIMDLAILKSIVADVISFGDATSNGEVDPDTDQGLASIIEAIAFSFPSYGGGNEIIRNSDLSSKNLPLDEAFKNEFKEVADMYDIPFSV